MFFPSVLFYGKLLHDKPPTEVTHQFSADIPGVQVAHDVLHKELRPTIPKKTPEPFASLMKRCWDKNPDKRPCFSEIID